MKFRHSIVIAGAALALSPLALADQGAQPQAAEDAGKSCTTLQHQFDQEVAAAQSDRAGEARALRQEGAQLCAKGEYDQGSAKIKEALTLIQGGPAPTS